MLGEGLAPDAAGSAIGQGDPCRDASAHWAEIRESKDKAMFEDHLRLFPACAFANIALQRMAALAPAVSRQETSGETECDRLAAAENDPFKLAAAKGVDFYKIDFARAIPAEALVQYRKAADLGNHQAMRNLAILYENGEGTAQDRAEAMRWFRKSADLGNAFAMNKVGLLYDEGLGVAKDKKEAYRWFSKAAEAGNAEAMTSLGFALTNGDGVEQNHALALEWYRKAADAGNAQAYNNIGTMYERGRAVRKDKQEALKWYAKAAENGNGQGAQNAAAILDGIDTENDPVTAAAWMEKALRLGHQGARYQMKDNTTAWSLKFRKALQQRLVEAGVYSGAIDGQFGPSTIRAVEAIFDKKAG
jgi:TPR repeat protein